MKLLALLFVAAIGLAGCVAVPYGPAPDGYYYGPGYYGPPASFSFNYSYRDGGYYGPRHRR